jgi:hypothetical protein
LGQEQYLGASIPALTADDDNKYVMIGNSRYTARRGRTGDGGRRTADGGRRTADGNEAVHRMGPENPSESSHAKPLI